MNRVAILVIFVTVIARSQPAFEVASIKIHEMPAGMTGLQIGGPSNLRISGDRVTTFGTLGMLVMAAFQVRLHEIAGEPDWTDPMGNPLTFDIQAKAGSVPTTEQARQMMQSLLVERFHLKAHQETRELPVYEVTLDKGGPKLKESDPGAETKSTSAVTRGVWKIDFTNFTMTEMATHIASNFDQPLLDRTGLKARYDFTLQYRRVLHGMTADQIAALSPTIYHALQQLGLRVVHTKAPAEIIVIDHAEKPGEN